MPQLRPEDFQFTYLHDYARYLADKHLDEFVLVGIRFSREADIPILKPLSKFSEEQLVQLGRESNKEMLLALAEKRTIALLEAGAKKWVENTLSILDRDEIMVEDLTIGYYIRRKIFAHFLDVYTKNVVLQKFIIAEVDRWTTREELFSYSLYLRIQQERLMQANNELELHRRLLLEAQEMGAMGSFAINFKDRSQSYFSPEYKRIFEIESVVEFDSFIQWVHADDQQLVKETVARVYSEGGNYEVRYRYNKSGTAKCIWSKGFVLVEDGKAAFIRGVAREVQ